MKKYLLLTAILVLMGYVVLPQTSGRKDASAEEYAVYSAAIAKMFDGERVTKAGTKPLVIRDVTDIDTSAGVDWKPGHEYFAKMFPALQDEVVRDYKVRNHEPLRLSDSLQLNFKYVLVDKKEIEKELIGSVWWDEFDKKYPDSGGFIILSRPGFNAAMNQALVYIHHGCGPLCGRGRYMRLEKSVDGWKVVQEETAWIA